VSIAFLFSQMIEYVETSKIKWTILVSTLICVSLALSAVNYYTTPLFNLNGQAPPAWESIQWIKENVSKDALVYSWNGYMHEAQMFNDHFNFKGDFSEEIQAQDFLALCNNTFPQTFGVEKLPPLNITLVNGSTYTQMELREMQRLPIDAFDYVILKDMPQHDVCIINMIHQLKDRNFSLAWSNAQFGIFKNSESTR
jgi:hypothetical protein